MKRRYPAGTVKRGFQRMKFAVAASVHPAAIARSVSSALRLFDLNHGIGRLKTLSVLDGISGEDLEDVRAELFVAYEAYVTEVSTPHMAISLELAGFRLVILRRLHPRRILDLGSGFSSYVFRHYARAEADPPVVITVDESREWLEKTRSFVVSRSLDDYGFVLWREFTGYRPVSFDLLLYDLGATSSRASRLPDVIELASTGALMIVDDVQKIRYRRQLREWIQSASLPATGLSRYTRDRFGRHAALVENKPAGKAGSEGYRA